MNEYENKHLNAIKDSKTDTDIIIIINKIYEDGFKDGCEEA